MTAHIIGDGYEAELPDGGTLRALPGPRLGDPAAAEAVAGFH